jgi:hypothetical protein
MSWRLASGTVEADRGAVFFEETTKTFGDAPVGTEVPVAFRLTNRSGRAVNVLGSSYTCFTGGCVRAVGLPLTVAPKTTREIVVAVATSSPAEFQGQANIFTDYPGLETVLLTVEGTVSGPRK